MNLIRFTLIPLRSWLSSLPLSLALATGSAASAADLLPPGHRPIPHHAHALIHARVIPEPGQIITNGTVLIRNGRIEQVGTSESITLPPDARVWDLQGATLYAGFIDLYWTFNSSSGPVNTASYDPFDRSQNHPNLTGGADNTGFFGVPGEERDPGNPGPGYELSNVTPERHVSDQFKPDPKNLEEMRSLGFTTACAVPDKGLIRGQSALVHLGDANPNEMLLKADTFQHLAFDTDTARDNAYPKSLMGIFAAWRQTVYDAQHHAATTAAYAKDPQKVNRPPQNPSLTALQPVLERKQKWVIEPGSVLMLDRASRIARELNTDYLLVASGEEWRRPELIPSWATTLITPVTQSAAPKMPTDDDWNQVSLDDLRAWDWAPENPAVIFQSKTRIALTTHGLGDRKDFPGNLRRAIQRGLPQDTAIAGLTTIPAAECGMENILGKVRPGFIANLTILEGGDYPQTDTRIREVWIDGIRYPSTSEPKPKKDKDKDKDKDKEKEKIADSSAPKDSDPNAHKEKSNAPAKKQDDKELIEKQRIASAPGRDRGPLSQPAGVFVRNATLWTCGPEGRIENGSLLILKGKIAAVGKNVPVPSTDAGEIQIIDGTGMHVTPGLIDAHNHSMIMGGVNESTLPSTAMVRIRDVINSEAATVYEQLAGGLTVANELHGSANPIGGQNCVIKLRLGAAPEDLIFQEAPQGIKFALGENVKQSNWGEKNVTRFPQTRMGVRTFFANRFTAAREYQLAWKTYLDQGSVGPAPRRNLELEAISEIIEGKRWIHCHSYRQDEILAFLRVMEEFKVKVGTLQHVLEGYKIADEIAKHGAGASCFADWWAYKFEVYDAIPQAGSLMHARGALVSFNSDSSDLARRMNLEAAKAVKYGGTSETDALHFVTINPAKQLRIDSKVGSLETGKDGDFVIWSKSPLDATGSCQQTWIEGRKYFDRSTDGERTARLAAERNQLIEKAKKLTDSASEKPASEAARAAFFRKLWETARHTDVFQCQDCIRP